MPRRALAIRARSGAILTLRAVAFELATCRTAPQRDARMPQSRKGLPSCLVRAAALAMRSGTALASRTADPRPVATAGFVRQPRRARVSRLRPSIPALFSVSIALIVGVTMINAVHRAIEHHDGVKRSQLRELGPQNRSGLGRDPRFVPDLLQDRLDCRDAIRETKPWPPEI
jgi:hypothetical protein